MVILSCGHREDDFDKHHSIATKDWTIGEDGWQKSICYQTVCETCYKEHQVEGSILESEAEEIQWLNIGHEYEV